MPTMPKIISQQPMHIHPHLDIVYQGQPVEVPAEIGIDASMYATHKFDPYIGDMGAAPIHTHDTSGTLHVESSVTARWNLGNFLDIWGLHLKGHSVMVVADGTPVKRYRSLKLADGQQIEMYIDS